MEKIFNQRDKYLSSVTSSEQIKNKFHDFVGQLDKINRQNNNQLSQETEKIERLKDKIAEQKEKFLVEEKNKKSLENELQNQAELLEELQNEKTRSIIENMEIEAKISQLKTTQPSNTDRKLVEEARKKLEYCRHLTGIKWDYLGLKNATKGWITNRNEYAHEFCFDINDEKTEEKLWEEIEKCVESDSKENNAPNK